MSKAETPTKSTYGRTVSAEELKAMSPELQDYVGDVYGIGEAPPNPDDNRYEGTPPAVEATKPEASAEAKEAAVAALGSAFHENWRKTRLDEKGEYEPRVKETKDKVWKAAHSTDQVDIANTEYADLPEDWQAENKAAAEVVVGILDEANGNIDLSDPAVRTEVGDRVHEAWMARNDWAKGGELDKPFGQLPTDEQAKDIEQVEIGLGLFKVS